MSEEFLYSLDINPKIIEAVKKAKLVPFKRILVLSPIELRKLTKLSDKDVSALLSAVSYASLKSKFVNAFQLQQSDCSEMYQQFKLSTGCPVINDLLNGGILTRTITEITGESASGKTQLCLQLAIQAQLPLNQGGLNSGVAYICTEDAFPTKRFGQLVHNFQKTNRLFNMLNFTDNVFISQIGDVSSMWICLKRSLPALLSGKHIKLIIIDSVAALFRSEYGKEECTKRSQDLQAFGFHVRKLANEYGAAVICINQVTAVVSKESGSVAITENVTPSLGLVWANLVTSRLMLSRTPYQITTDDYLTVPVITTVRLLKIIFSPYLPQSSCHFIITTDGIKGLN